VKAAVANLPKGLKCILGNLLYKGNDDIDDLIQIKQSKGTRCSDSRSEAKIEVSVSDSDATPTEVTGLDETPMTACQRN